MQSSLGGWLHKGEKKANKAPKISVSKYLIKTKSFELIEWIEEKS